jgi:uncharacterized protein
VAFALLGVVLTNACNLTCEYCCVSKSAGRHLSWPALRASLEVLLANAGENPQVTFTGGEPLVRFATLSRAVLHVERTLGAGRVRWRIITNGLLLDARVLSFLDAHGFFVNLSFDGVPGAQALRGPGTFERLDHLLCVLSREHPTLFEERLKVCLTLSPDTMFWLGDSIRYFLRRRIHTFTISPVTAPASWELARIAELDRAFDDVSAVLLDHYERAGQVPFLLFRKAAPDVQRQESEWTCDIAERRQFVVDVDGDCYRCLPAAVSYRNNASPVLQAAGAALNLGPAYAPGFGAKLGMLADAARATAVFRNTGLRYSSYMRCADCSFNLRCRICPLAGLCIPGWDSAFRVPDFLCAFQQVSLAHRDRFPCQPTARDFLSGRVSLFEFERSMTRARRPTAEVGESR